MSIYTESETLSMTLDSANNMDEKENITDNSAMAPFSVSAGTSEPLHQGEHNMLNMDDFFQRPVLLEEFDIVPGTPFLQILQPWALYSADPTVRSKLRNSLYLRADLKLRFVISGSPFHFGNILASFQPYASFNKSLEGILSWYAASINTKTALMNYLSQSPGAVIMDVKTNQPTDMTIPFICPAPMFRLYNETAPVSELSDFTDLIEAGDVIITSLNDLGSVSSTPTNVHLAIYAWMENVELGTTTGTIMQINTESETIRIHTESRKVKDEREVGPVEKFASSAKQVANVLTPFPYIGVAAKASSMAFGALEGISALFGWSKPIMINEPQFVKNAGFQNGALTTGYDTNFRMVLDPKQELTVDPRVVGMSVDEMNLQYLASIESFLTHFHWAPADEPLVSIFQCAVTPQLTTVCDTATHGVVMQTAMSFAVLPFQYWRADIVFRVQVVCSAFHRGKLAIFYEPNTQNFDSIAADFHLNKQYLHIIDIQDTQEITFRVNWAFNRAWATSSFFNNCYTNDHSANPMFLEAASMNGVISIVPYTQLTSPIDDDIQVNVFVHAENFHVNGLTNLRTDGYTRAYPPTYQGVIKTESQTLSHSPGGIVDLNKSSAVTDNISLMHFGEEIFSFRSMLKRYVTTRYDAVPAKAAATPQALVIDHDDFPFNNVPVGSTSTSALKDPWSYLRPAYMAWRGGIRYRTWMQFFPETSVNSQVKVTRRPPEYNSNVLSYSTMADQARSQLVGTIPFTPTSNAGIEYEMPFSSNNLFLFSFSDDIMGPVSAIDSAFRSHYILRERDVITPASQVLFDAAAAEDFSFMRYQGPCFWSYEI